MSALTIYFIAPVLPSLTPAAAAAALGSSKTKAMSSSTSHYTSFAVAGGTGNIGKSTAASLLAEIKGAHVVVLSRSESSSVVEGAERRVVADYNDVDALAKALQGTQVVINALGQGSLADESSKNLARAAKQAGAELIVPNEWGVDLEAIHKSDTEVHPFLLGKIAFPKFANEVSLSSSSDAMQAQ